MFRTLNAAGTSVLCSVNPLLPNIILKLEILKTYKVIQFCNLQKIPTEVTP